MLYCASRTRLLCLALITSYTYTEEGYAESTTDRFVGGVTDYYGARGSDKLTTEEEVKQ